jgi:3-dehydroquinate synthase
MMTLELSAGAEKAPYHIGEGALAALPDLVRPHVGGRQPFVVTDANVGPLYASEIAERLDAPCLELPTGEEHKRWSTVEHVLRWLVSHEVDRQSILIAVGGGVITDLAGFAASVLLRGVPWIAVPTTLLGMVDAAVGGKTGIDLDVGKNLVGAFWPPRAVIADPLVLATLHLRQMRSGLSEVIKSAMIAAGGQNVPIRFLPRSRSTPVLPPTAASTMPSSVVGAATHGRPRRATLAANPAMSVRTPPPTATTSSPRSTPKPISQVTTRSTLSQRLYSSPAGSSRHGASSASATDCP